MTPPRPINRDAPFPDLPIDAFLYGHEGPWPQPSRDHPFGQAPGIYNIPKEEWADWQTYVGDYYLEKVAEFGGEAAMRSVMSAVTNAADYAPITDADFTTLLCEGLYSKFLAPLDPRDEETFRDYIEPGDRWQYWKSEYTCMRVVRKPWPGEAVAASIALIRRPRNDTGFHYQVVALKLQVWDKDHFVDSEIFTPDDSEAWRVARYFVLQGAIHRINLIDHTEVHFPPDAINAITKTALPCSNLVLRLLQPHLWLSLCVNNTVLEGQRSLINRDTWYPWSPFVAKGEEVRRLLPFGWYGSTYYAAKGALDEPYRDAYFDEPNSSYPPFSYDPIPPDIPSRYGVFLNAYFAPVQQFVRGVVEHMEEADWREIGYWAEHIAVWVRGFPSRDALVGTDGKTYDKDLLANVLAHFIWNASVRHSADHQTLHEMVDGKRDAQGKIVVPARPVPFILRVKPPLKKDYKLAPVEVDNASLSWTEWFEKMAEKWAGNIPLCWPADPMSAHWADLLFYVPHNSLQLTGIGVDPKGDPNKNYAFETPELRALVEQFHAALRQLDQDFARNRPDHCFVPLDDIASSIQY
ncbi:hypothetical protein [Niveibacterium sp. SC-1]|uniref:hypothetical protein n=1 Tax=Niveibacterium sp. SC-1 TaxID=3135646 RepID=UPI00311E2E3B